MPHFSKFQTVNRFQNAWNTGLAALRSRYVAIVNDYTWLPANFIETVAPHELGTHKPVNARFWP